MHFSSAIFSFSRCLPMPSNPSVAHFLAFGTLHKCGVTTNWWSVSSGFFNQSIVICRFFYSLWDTFCPKKRFSDKLLGVLTNLFLLYKNSTLLPKCDNLTHFKVFKKLSTVLWTSISLKNFISNEVTSFNSTLISKKNTCTFIQKWLLIPSTWKYGLFFPKIPFSVGMLFFLRS